MSTRREHGDNGVPANGNDTETTIEGDAMSEQNTRTRGVTAERDALAAALEQVRKLSRWSNTYGPDEFGDFKRKLRAILSTAPATVLAQRDREQRVEGVTLAAAYLKEHDLTRPGDAIHALHRLAEQVCESERIELESQ